MWVARDEDGKLTVFEVKPKRDTWYGYWCETGNLPYRCNDEITISEWESSRRTISNFLFPDLKWEDEPIEVELVVKVKEK